MQKSWKQFLLKTLPGPTEALRAAWQRRHVRHVENRLGLPEIKQAYVAHHNLRIAGGPFRDMAYVSDAVGSAFVPKLLGSYEAELHDLVTEILAKEYHVVVDVGCAEGYYAIGLALHLPKAHIYAFDTDLSARRLCLKMANANGVQGRVTVAGKCDAKTLDHLLTEPALVVCDCEGYEVELLHPDRCPGLIKTDILVELHDGDFGNTALIVPDRFQLTHTLSFITSVERDPDQYPELAFLSSSQRHLAVSEFRSLGQQWAFLEAKAAVVKEDCD